MTPGAASRHAGRFLAHPRPAIASPRDVPERELVDAGRATPRVALQLGPERLGCRADALPQHDALGARGCASPWFSAPPRARSTGIECHRPAPSDAPRSARPGPRPSPRFLAPTSALRCLGGAHLDPPAPAKNRAQLRRCTRPRALGRCPPLRRVVTRAQPDGVVRVLRRHDHDGRSRAIAGRCVARSLASLSPNGTERCARVARDEHGKTHRPAAGRRASRDRWVLRHVELDTCGPPTAQFESSGSATSAAARVSSSRNWAPNGPPERHYEIRFDAPSEKRPACAGLL